jgi:hypothetical protein
VAASLYDHDTIRDTQITGNLLMESGCQPHVCPYTGDAFVFDLNTSALIAAIHDNDTITVYGSGSNDVDSVPKLLRDWIDKRQAGMSPPPKITVAVAYKPTTIELVAGKEYKVPPQREWQIVGLALAEVEGSARTADLEIDGQVIIGTTYALSGKFDLSILEKQKEPVHILADSKVEVGESRGTIEVEETAHRN